MLRSYLFTEDKLSFLSLSIAYIMAHYSDDSVTSFQCRQKFMKFNK